MAGVPCLPKGLTNIEDGVVRDVTLLSLTCPKPSVLKSKMREIEKSGKSQRVWYSSSLVLLSTVWDENTVVGDPIRSQGKGSWPCTDGSTCRDIPWCHRIETVDKSSRGDVYTQVL